LKALLFAAVNFKKLNRSEYNTSIDTYAKRIHVFVFRLVKNHEDTNDIVQDVFEKLWINRADVEVEKVKAWLFTTAYNLSLNFLKKKKPQYLDDAYYNEPFVNGRSFEVRDTLDKVMEFLPPIQKSIILLRDMEGYAYEEIAEILHLSESQVKVYLFRGRQRVKNILKDLTVLVA
jgi:RNA polymerase sigma factor (sigma-70 family)